jgi:hypothetical protein
MLQGFIDRKRVAGAVTVILRDGKVAYVRHRQRRRREGRADADRHDLPHRLAVEGDHHDRGLILLDEGKLLLNDPVSKFIRPSATPR